MRYVRYLQVAGKRRLLLNQVFTMVATLIPDANLENPGSTAWN